MNKESSIKQLKRIKQDMIHADDVNALDFAIRFMESKALDQEPKAGHWKRNETIRVTYCSECGFGQYIDEYRTYNYCPNCGAKMESEE